MSRRRRAKPDATCPSCGLEVGGYALGVTRDGRTTWDRPAKREVGPSGIAYTVGGLTHVEGGQRCIPGSAVVAQPAQERPERHMGDAPLRSDGSDAASIGDCPLDASGALVGQVSDGTAVPLDLLGQLEESSPIVDLSAGHDGQGTPTDTGNSTLDKSCPVGVGLPT